MDNEPEEKKEKAISVVKSIGYDIEPLNVNTSGVSWEPRDKQSLIQPLSSIKGLGDKAIEQVVNNRPFNTIENLLFNENIKYQKLNKRGIDVLIRSGACNKLMDNRFNHQRHFWLSCAFEKPKTLITLKSGI